jgi:oligopeptidase A
LYKFEEFEHKDIDKKVEQVQKRIKKNQKEIKKILDIKYKNFQNFCMPFFELEEALNFEFQPISHLNGIANSKETQKAVKKLLPILSDYSTKLSQNRAVYEAIKDTVINSDLTKEQKMAIRLELVDFEMEGVTLDSDKKKKIEKINSKLSQLENEFSQNVLDDTNSYEMIIEDENILSEMPAIEKAQAHFEKSGKSNYKFTLHAPSFISFMTYANDRQKREELYKAHCTRGAKNASLMTEILSLRDEKAKILDFENYSELSLGHKSAPSPKAVDEFLLDLAQKSKPYALKELHELSTFAKKFGVDKLESFDLAYYSEKLKKEQFDIDEEHFKNYFESRAVVKGMFVFVEKLFGISFKKAKAKTWTKKAEAYDLYENGDIIGRLYLDLEARKNKKGGAWMDNWTSGSITPEGKKRLPIAYITCNFSPSSKENPSLLRHSDVETLFHEMGHALHHLLSKTTVCSVSGVNGVLWDVVEFPSQFLENFVYEKSVLELFARHYQTKEPLSDEDINKLIKAKNFQAALGMLRQLEFGLFDMKIHKKAMSEEEVAQTLSSVRDEVSVFAPPQYNRFQHSFTHIFGGSYSAGYYSYKWAEVLSADAYMTFSDSGVFDKNLGIRMRESVFAKGGSCDMNELFVEFAGRSADSSALLRSYGLL